MTAFVAGEGPGWDAGNGTAEIQPVNESSGLGRRRGKKESDAILRLMLSVWYG